MAYYMRELQFYAACGYHCPTCINLGAAQLALFPGGGMARSGMNQQASRARVQAAAVAQGMRSDTVVSIGAGGQGLPFHVHGPALLGLVLG